MDEKLKILKMVSKGKVSPEEGLELLQSIESIEERVKPSKWLKIKVWEKDHSTEKPKVNISLPLGLAKSVLQFIPKEQLAKIKLGDNEMNLQDLDIDELINNLRSYGPMTLVEIDEEDEKILIVIE